MNLTRRGFIASLFAAPIIVRTGILMPVTPLPAEEFIVTAVSSGNTLLTPTEIAHEALRLFHQRVPLLINATRRSDIAINGKYGFQPGDTVRVS